MSKNDAIEPAAEPSDLLVTAAQSVIVEPPTGQVPLVPAAVDEPLHEPGVESGPAAYTVQVECPNCGSVWEGNDVRPHAEWFCGNCDYPLFWVLPPGTSDGVEGDGAFSRLPGTDGRDFLTSIACPHCGERNPPDPSADCLRCGLPLTPVHVEPAPEPVVITIERQIPPPPPRKIWPWVLAACVFATAFVITLVILLND
jgi:predicted RNA-binding Zn-ribbon protein involved in translation (DUF1610 family)